MIMEGTGFSEVIQYFFQFGPFAILPYLMLFALPRLYKQMKTASGDLKKILKRNIFIYQMLVVLLVVFCVGFWTFSPGGSIYYYGEIKNLNAARDEVESSQLYFKTHLIDGVYIVKWIWKKQQDDTYAEIKLKGKDPESGLPTAKKFKLHANHVKKGRRYMIEYNEDNGVLMHDPDNDEKFDRLAIAMDGSRKPARQQERTIDGGVFVPLLYAAPPGRHLDPRRTLENMQAIKSGIREQTVELVVQFADKDRAAVIKTLQLGFQLLQGNAPGAAVQQRQLYNRDHLMSSLLLTLNRLTQKWGSDLRQWTDILGEKTFELIAEETNSRNPYIRKLAHTFLSKFKKEMPRVMAEKVKEGTGPTKKMDEGIQISKLATRPVSAKLNVKVKPKPKPQALAVKEKQSVKEKQPVKKKQVLAAAMALMKKNIPYEWGGKSPEKGFDASGFIAYIFHRAGLLEKPGDWWSGKLRKELGTARKNKIPGQAGDLVFYTGGYVMLYLGNNDIIGMTPGGIIIRDYRKFSSRLIQVNRIDYD
ncbi:MAG: hypothetical protein GY950_30385 [bacterium]|nr:hypothetical protein [bacterium]